MQRYIAFDVETPNERNHRMSAIGISVIEDGAIVRDFYSLVNPETYFADFNIRLTGITPEKAAEAPAFPEIWKTIAPLMDSGIPVAHNAVFDLGVLEKCLRDYGIAWRDRTPYLCTVQMGRKLLPGMSHRLDALCDFYHIDLNHHRADSDSRACAEILLRYLQSGERAEDHLRIYYFRPGLKTVPAGNPGRGSVKTEEDPDEKSEASLMNAAREILRRVYGHEQFREGQEKTVGSLLRKRDAFCVMPTGSGKSLCYQIPALAMTGTSLVISPLISLMKDQVAALRNRGIVAACLNSGMSRQEAAEARREAAAGRLKILYIAPERLQGQDFLELARGLDIPFVAIDEAHCISQWGQDFRPSYLRIPEFISQLPVRPTVGAFTATATPRVRQDILKNLRMRDPVCVTSSFDRPNLSFSVYDPKDRDQALLRLLRERFRQSGIVYCATRKTVESVCEMLREEGFTAVRYHAGLEKEERARNQDDFLFDRSRIMVATNAFGMGIDKSNVSFVIHYNMPMSLEAYYQEAGRAGRDGCDADCILLYSGQDVILGRWLIEHSEGNPDLTPEQQANVQARDQERLKRMAYYARTKKCLRRDILRYFGEDSPERCNNCSNCVADCEHIDITVPAQMILSSIARTEECLETESVIALLRGETPPNLPEKIRTETLTTFGLMKDTPASRLGEQIRTLLDQGYLERDEEGLRILRLNQSSREVLFRNRRVVMRKRTEASERPEANVDLFQALQHMRYLISGEEHIAASTILSDSTLREICRLLPADRQALSRIDGMGLYKANRYGDRILQVMRPYLSPAPGQEKQRPSAVRRAETRSTEAGNREAAETDDAQTGSTLRKKIDDTVSAGWRERIIQRGSTEAYAPWTEEEDARLKEELKAHKTPKEMSEMHHRTRGAILSRLKKLNLI